MPNLSLPAGLVTRSATQADAQGIADLNIELELAELGTSDSTPGDVHEFWNLEHFDLAANTCLVSTLTGKVVGYSGVALTKEGVMLDVHTGVRLAYQESLEGSLLQWAEEQAEKLLMGAPGVARVIRIWSGTAHMSRTLAERGYRIESSDYQMEIIMQEAPAEPEVLVGITIRTFQAGKEERAVYEVVAEAFPDIDGQPYRPYEEWYPRIFEQSTSFEPEMLYVAEAEGEIVGVTICRTYPEDHGGYVWQVAVRRAWRRRGIALQLLRSAFAEFYRRGMYNVQLSVDLENQTGGLELYKRVGMYKRSQIDTMSKGL